MKKPRNTLRAAIIENELDAQSLLSSIISEFCPNLSLVGTAASISNGLTMLEETKPDIVFLDIEIEEGTSFEMLSKIPNYNFNIIFTTAYDHYALEAFKYGAIDYLLKPYSPQDVLAAIERVHKSHYDNAIFNRIEYLLKQNTSSSGSRIAINTSDGISFISINDIIRIEADRSYCYLHLSDGEKLLVSKPLKELESQLQPANFFRVHSTHLINTDYIKKYSKEDGGTIIMTDGSIISIARRRKQEFLETIFQQ